MASGLVADRPGAADISRRSGRSVILPFAELMSDWVDRRKINNVEPHVRRVTEALFTICERPMFRSTDGASGKNSYHVENRALTRSTKTSSSRS